MFKKPLSDIKTMSSLRSSERRKLKQRMLQEYKLEHLSSELVDLLMPEGLLSKKFATYNDELGVAYLSSDDEPLWFTLGKGGGKLTPTVYTLWKYPRLLPYISTPPSVIPVLINGADLMIPGVVEHSDGLIENQLVAVSSYSKDVCGPPLAVGRLVVPEARLHMDGAKGRAVHILHIYKDKLWEMGSKCEPPETMPRDVVDDSEADVEGRLQEGGKLDDSEFTQEARDEDAGTSASLDRNVESVDVLRGTGMSPDEISSILRSSLIQAIQTTLAELPPGSFPMSATNFYTSYILPARPAQIVSQTPIDVKHSSHKTLSTFLKSSEKEKLLSLKGQAKGKGGGDMQISSITLDHPDVQVHTSYRTIAEVEAKRAACEERQLLETKKLAELVVAELWKPHLQSLRLFEAIEKDASVLYSAPEVKQSLDKYITFKSLVNPYQQQFVNIDDLLRGVLVTKGSEVPDFMKRDELLQSFLEKMQPWHRIGLDGRVRKGELNPISVTVKIRQGRKACTLITGFEQFNLEPEVLTDELRRRCASSTSIASLPGRNAGQEIMVQGKQMKAATEILLSKGIAKKWVQASDLSNSKK